MRAIMLGGIADGESWEVHDSCREWHVPIPTSVMGLVVSGNAPLPPRKCALPQATYRLAYRRGGKAFFVLERQDDVCTSASSKYVEDYTTTDEDLQYMFLVILARLYARLFMN